MDALALILPGAQSLVSTILTEGWAQARKALARGWSKKGAISEAAADEQLDRAHELSQHFENEAPETRRELLEAYWSGYLAGLSAAQADLLDAIRELGTAPQGSNVHNSNTGQARTLLQTGDINGSVNVSR